VKVFEVELDETVCKWLEHIAEMTEQTIEEVISNGICQQVVILEEAAMKAFTYQD